MKPRFFLLLLLLTASAMAQTRRQADGRELVVHSNKAYRLTVDQPYTSALIAYPTGETLQGTYLVVAGDTLPLQADPHAGAGKPMSALVVFRQPVTQLTLQTGTLAGAVLLQLFYAPPLPAGYVQAQVSALARQGSECVKPAVIPASVWRAGLTPPKELPVQTKVQFIVVHHSVTSNTATDQVEEVRNIYLLHTLSNGWNDIGYNFLIGRDGVIYEGRDGQGMMDGDNVLGAHFCAQNSGTMGICLLGNFNEAQPGSSAIASLAKLIGWKLKKEGLQPIGMAFHPGSAKQLDVISGHRDGVCTTECPGNNLYAALPAIRQEVGQVCSFEPTPLATGSSDVDWVVYPNPSRAMFQVRYRSNDPFQVRFDLFDLLGNHWPVRTTYLGADTWQVASESLPTGLFFLRYTDGPASAVKQIWHSRE
ncbi:N-acetylmuramoyl-L-alanine amidase [Fibrella arboris]|uniref:N-acetylmuramoyl-L-alanine amidase n=1 Tax=Fibrella arboris TaxID=3242486 RepID=UPI00351FB296